MTCFTHQLFDKVSIIGATDTEKVHHPQNTARKRDFSDQKNESNEIRWLVTGQALQQNYDDSNPVAFHAVATK